MTQPNPYFKEIVAFIRQLYNEQTGVIPLHAPVFNGNEKKYLEDCIDITFVSSVGKYVDLFEEKMAEYTGARKAVACVNGTSALHLALKLVGVEAGHAVITQPLTFVATANAISYCGASPVFLDVDMDTMGLSPQSLLRYLETETIFDSSSHRHITKSSQKPITACVPMHTFGHPCRIDEIVEICKAYNIIVVEDAAESLGSFYKNQHTGTFGEIGVLSFNGNKVITTGGGGMLLFKDEAQAKRAKHLTTQAKMPHPWEFVHNEVGYNYRMPNINAAIGLAQLEQLPNILQSKRKIAKLYQEFFERYNSRNFPTDLQSTTFVSEPDNSSVNYWLNCILFPNKTTRNEFLKYSNENGVMTRPAWRLMNELDMFKGAETGKLENAIFIADRLVNIPSSAFLADHSLSKIKSP